MYFLIHLGTFRYISGPYCTFGCFLVNFVHLVYIGTFCSFDTFGYILYILVHFEMITIAISNYELPIWLSLSLIFRELLLVLPIMRGDTQAHFFWCVPPPLIRCVPTPLLLVLIPRPPQRSPFLSVCELYWGWH